MKHMVFGVLSGGIVILFVVMLLTMQHKNVRKEELEQSLTEAMETTLQMVQAVSDSSSGAAGYIFWNAGSVNGVEASDACAIMTHQESKKSFKVAVSDPTQTADTVTVNVTLPENGMTVSSQSDNITVSVNGNTASITVDLSAHYGWSYEVVFGK